MAGIVKSQSTGQVTVQIGSSEVVLRTSEIARIEKNDRTGAFDREKAQAAALERSREVTKLTGLRAPERIEVRQTMSLLLSADPLVNVKARRKLVAMGKEVDLFRYFEHSLPTLLPRYVPGVLEVLVELDPKRARPLLWKQSTNVDAACRAKALELMGKVQDYDSIPLLMRGLVDHAPEVRIAASSALGALRVKEATPVLMENLKMFDIKIRNAGRLALQTIWSTPDKQVDLHSMAEWEAFWSAQSSSLTSPYNVSALEPLVPPGVAFEDE